MSETRLRQILIEFPVDVELPDEAMRLIHQATSLVCEAYEREHPDEVMWASGIGSMPVWRYGDIEGFDDAVYNVSVSVREAYGSEKIVCQYCNMRRASYVLSYRMPPEFCCRECRSARSEIWEPIWKWAKEHPELVPK